MGSSKLYPEPATTGSQSTRFSSQAIRKELDRILSSTKLARARQIHRFLRFVVEKTLAGRQDQIKQYTIGTEALGRSPDFNPTENPIVRIEAGRVRRAPWLITINIKVVRMLFGFSYPKALTCRFFKPITQIQSKTIQQRGPNLLQAEKIRYQH